MYREEVEKLKEQISRDLRSSARSYYKIGIDSFHESRMRSWADFQPAIGNLCIGVELLLKAVVAEKALAMLYSGLPDEAMLLLCYPDSLTDVHNSLSYANDLKYFTFKAIEIDKAVSLFYHFYPELKQEYKSFLSSLSSIRNISVHASVPDFQRYEMESIAYHSTKLFMKLSEIKVFKFFSIALEKKTENFIKYYEEEKVKKVKLALEAARKKVKSGKIEICTIYCNDWDSMSQECPICGSSGTLVGETDESSDENGITLTFECDAFSCEACGLELEDYEELTLANIDTSIDRDNDVDKWCREKGYDEYEDMW